MSGGAGKYDPITLIAVNGINIFWSDLYPEPVRLFPADGVAFAHPAHTTASLRAGLAQALSAADTLDATAALDYAAHLLISGEDLAHACTHHSSGLDAARSLGVTLAMFERRISGLNRQGRNQVRLRAARSLCRACRVRQEPLALGI